VWKNNTRLWVMNYYGNIHSVTAPIKEVTKFLKEAMKKVNEDRPFRVLRILRNEILNI